MSTKSFCNVLVPDVCQMYALQGCFYSNLSEATFGQIKKEGSMGGLFLLLLLNYVMMHLCAL